MKQLYCLHCGAANDASAEYCFACNYGLNQSEPLAEADQLLHDRYQLLHKSGTGGFGMVYKARDTHSYNQYVALKRITLRGLAAQEVIEATDGFNREVQILSRLSHPHLPRILDYFTDQENWYLVMDFIEGETLEIYLRHLDNHKMTRPLPLSEALDIAMQLCSVLDYLHTLHPPVIFRDLKPGNIMRTPMGKLYVIDFGIARHFKPGQSKDTMLFGSPGYAAPEQYGKAQTTPAADIYSLGALLHQMLTGIDPSERPFCFTPLQLYSASGLERLNTLLQLMVAMDADKRPASIKAVQAELQTIVDQQPATHLKRHAKKINDRAYYNQDPAGMRKGSGSSSQQYQQQLQPVSVSNTGRRTVLKGLLLLGIVGATAGGIGSYIIGHMPHDKHVEVPLTTQDPPLTAQLNPPDQLSTANALVATHHQQDQGEVNAVRYTPNGRFLASGNTHGVVQLLDATNASVLANISVSSDAILMLAWSFDGRYLACSTKKAIYIIEIMIGTGATTPQASLSGPTLVYSNNASPQSGTKTLIYTLAWSPKEYLLAVSDYTCTTHVFQFEQEQLQVLDIGQYPSRPVNTTFEFASNQLAWSPDGKQIISVTQPAGYSVWQAKDQQVIADVTFARPVPVLMLGWQTDKSYPIILITHNTIHFGDINGRTRYDYLLPDKVVDIAYGKQAFDIFIALASGDIYHWLPEEGDPFLVKNGDDTLASLNSITTAQVGGNNSLVAAFSDGTIISYKVPPSP